MTEGVTIIIHDTSMDVSVIEKELTSLDVLKTEKDDTDKNLKKISFDHSGKYSISSFTKIIKDLLKRGCPWLRAYHYDDYGHEEFWLIKNGKFKKYSHDVDGENEDFKKIVQCYKHWNSDIGECWFGHFTRAEIDVLSDKYGHFNSDGKRMKAGPPDFDSIITENKEFIGVNLKVPYESAWADSHIEVYLSYAKEIALHSNLPPSDLEEIKFERTYRYNNYTGYVFSWEYNGKTPFLFIQITDLSATANIGLSSKDLTLDEFIFINIYRRAIGKDFWGEHTQIYTNMEQVAYPPTRDYILVPPSQVLGKDFFSGLTHNVDVHITGLSDGRVVMLGGDADDVILADIVDIDFKKYIEEMQDSIYLPNEYTSTKEIEKYPSVIFSKIQARFSEKSVVDKVFGGTIREKKPQKNNEDCKYSDIDIGYLSPIRYM